MAFVGDYLFLIICNNSFKVFNSYSSDVIFSNYNNRKHFSMAVYLQPHSIKLIKKIRLSRLRLRKTQNNLQITSMRASSHDSRFPPDGRLETSQREVCWESGTNQSQTSYRPLAGSCCSRLHTFP